MKKSKTNNNLNLDFSAILKEQDSYSRFSVSRSNDMLQNMMSNKDKNSIIYQLQKELQYVKEVNKNYLNYSNYSAEVTKKYEKNYNEIVAYKEKLEKDLNSFIIRMNNYESLKNKNIDFKDEITKNKESMIEIILKDQKKLQDAYKKINDDCLKTENENKELLEKLEKISIQMKKDQKECDEMFNIDNKAISIVQEKIDENEFKINFYKNKEQLRLLGFSLNGEKQNEQKNKEDLDILLNEKKSKNELLKQRIKELKAKIRIKKLMSEKKRRKGFNSIFKLDKNKFSNLAILSDRTSPTNILSKESDNI